LGLCIGAKIQILQKLIAARVIGERVRGGKRKFKGLRVANFSSTYYRGAWPRRVLQKIGTLFS